MAVARPHPINPNRTRRRCVGTALSRLRCAADSVNHRGAVTGAASLSVVLVTTDTFVSVRRTVEHLARQTVRDRMELVLVAPSRATLDADATLLGRLGSTVVVEVGDIGSIGAANAAGVRRASAPVVVLAEDHCFPEPDWAAALIAAHRGDCAAVGPVVRNANPATAVSWADLFIGYGPWLGPCAGGAVDFLPGHNTSYKRAVLLGYGDRLEAMLGAETLLHWDLRAAGHRLLLEPTARVAHTNFSRWASWVRVQVLAGRVFAGARGAAMHPVARLAYVAGSPLIPLVRLVRIARTAPPALRGRLFRTLPALSIGLVLDALGQMAGYAFGAGDAPARLARFEYQRVRHLTPGDRRAVFGA